MVEEEDLKYMAFEEIMELPDSQPSITDLESKDDHTNGLFHEEDGNLSDYQPSTTDLESKDGHTNGSSHEEDPMVESQRTHRGVLRRVPHRHSRAWQATEAGLLANRRFNRLMAGSMGKSIESFSPSMEILELDGNDEFPPIVSGFDDRQGFIASVAYRAANSLISATSVGNVRNILNAIIAVSSK